MSASSTSARRATIPHLPALDGLRGLAVLGVLLFHDDRLRGGYLGVDLFFVLSGFLITSLLLAEWGAAGRIDLKAFWIRRARRLFPALLAILPAVALYARFLAEPAELSRIRYDGLATLGYVANWRAIFAGRSYWDMFNAPSPLEHTWSLAIEEQFYVFWPLLTVLVLRLGRGSARALLGASSVLALGSAAAMWLLYRPENTSRVYMGTDTRGCSILVGAALACALAGRGAMKNERLIRALDGLGLLAVVGLGWAWVTLEGQSHFLYRGGFWLTELAVLVLIACATQDKKSLIARALAFRPLVLVGLVSYGVYLWHWPVYVVLNADRLGFGGLGLSALRYAVTFAVALVSYKLLEQPIRKHGLRFGRPILVVPAAVGLDVAVILLATRGAALAPAAAVAAAAQKVPEKSDPLRTLPPAGKVPEGVKRVLVLGDSVAEALGERMHAMQEGSGFIVAERGIGNCSLLEHEYRTLSLDNKNHEHDCDEKWASDVAEMRPDVTFIVLGGGFFARIEIDGQWQRPCEKGWYEAFTKELKHDIELIRPNAGRIVMARVPYPVKHWISPGIYERIDCYNDALRDVAASFPGITVIDLQSHLCPGSKCVMDGPNGYPIRPDGLHPAGWGAEDLARWTLSQLK